MNGELANGEHTVRSGWSYVLPLGLLAIASAGTWWVLRDPETEPAPAAPESKPPAPAASAPIAPTPSSLPPKPAELAEQRPLRLPDGSEVKPLNGVREPAALVWGDAPWSPIVRVEHNNGLDWYVHADGTYTTTMMQWRGDLKRVDPVTLCLHPATPTGIEPREPTQPPGTGR